MCGLRVILVDTCYYVTYQQSYKKNDFLCILHEVQDLANLHYINCIAQMDFTHSQLSHDRQLIIVLPNISIFFSSEDESVV